MSKKIIAVYPEGVYHNPGPGKFPKEVFLSPFKFEQV
jgi:hypothetical protein